MNSNSKNTSRRSFLEKMGALGILAPFVGIKPVSAEWQNARPETLELMFSSKPYLQSPAAQSMTIRTITNNPALCWVEYGRDKDRLSEKQFATIDGLINAYNSVHDIPIDQLQPDTTYYYRICAKAFKDFQPYKVTYGETIYSDIYHFNTLPAKPTQTSFLVLNDIHDRPKSFATLMSLNTQPYDFVFLNGDMFDYQTGEQQLIDHLITPCTESFATEKPFIFIRGNHEVRGKFAREIKPYFSNYGNGQFFTLDLGPVFMIALDTGEDKEDSHPVYAGLVDFDHYRALQAQWLERQMQSKAFRKAKFRVVMMHIPMFYSGDAHGTLHCREMFNELCNKYKVDIVISGHTHQYGVHPPVKGQHNYPIIIGGGPKEGKRTIMHVTADDKQLTLQMLDDHDNKVGQYIINS